jgi:hypothetical protein
MYRPWLWKCLNPHTLLPDNSSLAWNEKEGEQSWRTLNKVYRIQNLLTQQKGLCKNDLWNVVIGAESSLSSNFEANLC